MKHYNKVMFVLIAIFFLSYSYGLYSLAQTSGYREGYFSGYDDGNLTGARVAYSQGKNVGYNEALSFRNYYIKNVEEYIVRPDISRQLPTTVADCRRADEVTKVSSETASMFPTITYFDSLKLIRVKDSDQMLIGQIYSRRLTNQTDNLSRSDIIHRLIRCEDYPTCDWLVFKGDNNLFEDTVIRRQDYSFKLLLSIEYGDSSSYYSKVRGK